MFSTKYINCLTILIFYQLFLFDNVKSAECNMQKVKIQCKKIYETEFNDIGKVKVCEDDSPLTIERPDIEIDEIAYANGTEIKNEDKIDALHLAQGKSIEFLPTGLNKKIPKLRALKISNSGIAYLTKWNLRQYGDNLEFIEFCKGSLSVLSADLFKFNQNLKFISFAENPLKHIENKFIENLKNLTKLKTFNSTMCGCIDREFKFFDLKNFTLKDDQCQDTKTSTEVIGKHIQMTFVQKIRKTMVKCEDLLDIKLNDIRKEIDENSMQIKETSKNLTKVIEATRKNVETEFKEKLLQIHKTLDVMNQTHALNMDTLKKSIPDIIEEEIGKNEENRIRDQR